MVKRQTRPLSDFCATKRPHSSQGRSEIAVEQTLECVSSQERKDMVTSTSKVTLRGPWHVPSPLYSNPSVCSSKSCVVKMKYPLRGSRETRSSSPMRQSTALAKTDARSKAQGPTLGTAKVRRGKVANIAYACTLARKLPTQSVGPLTQ